MRLFCIIIYLLINCSLLSAQKEKDIDTSDKINSRGIVWNTTGLLEYNGRALQLGYRQRLNNWLEGSMEVGWVTNRITDTPFPFTTYNGVKFRPEIIYRPLKSIGKSKYPVNTHLGFTYIFQHLNFIHQGNFEVNNTFFQRINVPGHETSHRFFLTGGVRIPIRSFFHWELSIAVGHVIYRIDIEENVIPENAFLIEDCFIICPVRSVRKDKTWSRMGGLFEMKFIYEF